MAKRRTVLLAEHGVQKNPLMDAITQNVQRSIQDDHRQLRLIPSQKRLAPVEIHVEHQQPEPVTERHSSFGGGMDAEFTFDELADPRESMASYVPPRVAPEEKEQIRSFNETASFFDQPNKSSPTGPLSPPMTADRSSYYSGSQSTESFESPPATNNLRQTMSSQQFNNRASYAQNGGHNRGGSKLRPYTGDTSSCRVCGEPPRGSYTITNIGLFHFDCFNCVRCNEPIGERDYMVEKDEPYCLACFQVLKGLVCGMCSCAIKTTDRRCIVALGKRWHMTCFVCSSCRKPFTGSFNVEDERPYCTECFQKLYS